MKFLIDTHVLLWIVSDSGKLSKKVKEIYLDENNEIFISIASIWEMAIKISLKKLKLSLPLSEFVQEHVYKNNIQIQNISLINIYRLESLPYHHRDPFDRLIISQTISENIPIISNDKQFYNYDIECIW